MMYWHLFHAADIFCENQLKACSLNASVSHACWHIFVSKSAVNLFLSTFCYGLSVCCSLDHGPTEVSLKVNELQKKFQQMREQIENLPGIDLSHEEQLRQMEVLRQQLAIKTELLRKYKDTDRFDILPS